MKKNITPDKLTKAYIKIRAERAALSSKYKEEDGVLLRQQEKVKHAMLDFCDETRQTSVKTVEGIFFVSEKTNYWIDDWESMHNFIKEHEVPELLDKRINKSNMKQFLEENPDRVPNSLNIEKERVVSVRKK